ncbi:gamma-glutamyltransferase [Carboxylicivirga sediminis]|uniref:Glutathione hydrolase proenzyme n=1 Tax=Carboxylicivirga sediminis TaxID=2006564 RepID=A0A941F0P5_9BACT|nr:gamma-glutamyltransferase [Carboxylicivirga sediminis]MBR8534339.1 gamma-glutamyltransferase [Carboxylicivirga sediminis]
MKDIQLLILLLSLIIFQTSAQDRITGLNFASRSEVIAQNGIACTSHPLSTQIAIDILKQGGNAIDAAIAANAALGLMEPTGCGIGGDLFALIWDANTKQLYGLNGSGRSPQTLSINYFNSQNLDKIPSYGPLSVSVPGCVDAWFELHQRFGQLTMEEILAPAISYAENGFPLSELIAYYWERSVKLHQKYPNVIETYTSNGNIPVKGDILKNPYLAETYRQLAKQGRNYFYKGKLAETITKFIKQQGGFLSIEDLASHRSQWVEPVSVNYRGYDIWELPPNGQGITALQMLNIIKGYSFEKEEFGTARHLHLVTEAKKLAFEDRAKYYADMDMQNVPVEKLISEEYAKQRRDLIDMQKAGQYIAGTISHGETIYLTVADRWGNMVSLIQSNYRGMGSGMVPPQCGFMLQNRGELFSLDPDDANALAPGKRPFHTIIPAFVTKNQQPVMSFGVMGGDFQPQGHVQVLMNIIDFGMNLQEAGDAPRFSHTGSSQPTGKRAKGKGQLNIETGFSNKTILELTKMGHSVGFLPGSYGGYQAIWYDSKRGVYIGASEKRKDGMAAGY